MATARVVRTPLVQPRDRDRSRHLRVVRTPRQGLGIRLSPRAGVVVTMLAFVALFAVAVCHALLIESQAAVDQLDKDVASEQARYEELRLEVAELKSPDRIMTQATQRLGMVPAGETVWLTPDEPAQQSDASEETADSPDTSAARVKPFLEATP